MQGMGLRQHPELRDMYFGHYTRLLYMAQIEDERLVKKAKEAAEMLGLRFEYKYTGYGEFINFMSDASAGTADKPGA